MMEKMAAPFPIPHQVDVKDDTISLQALGNGWSTRTIRLWCQRVWWASDILVHHCSAPAAGSPHPAAGRLACGHARAEYATPLSSLISETTTN
jgi:hypothetical protein